MAADRTLAERAREIRNAYPAEAHLLLRALADENDTLRRGRYKEQLEAVDRALPEWETDRTPQSIGVVGRVTTIENLVADRAERDRYWNLAVELGEALENLQCSNCDDRLCMGCVLREHPHECEDDCPDCCGDQAEVELVARRATLAAFRAEKEARDV